MTHWHHCALCLWKLRILSLKYTPQALSIKKNHFNDLDTHEYILFVNISKAAAQAWVPWVDPSQPTPSQSVQFCHTPRYAFTYICIPGRKIVVLVHFLKPRWDPTEHILNCPVQFNNQLWSSAVSPHELPISCTIFHLGTYHDALAGLLGQTLRLPAA